MKHLQSPGINEFCLTMGFSSDFQMDPEESSIWISIINKCFNKLS